MRDGISTQALSASLLKPPGEQKKGLLDGFFAAFNRAFDKATDRFMVLSDFFLGNLARAGALLAVLIIGLVFLFRAVPGGFVPEEDQGYLVGGLVMPDGASLQRTDQVTEYGSMSGFAHLPFDRQDRGNKPAARSKQHRHLTGEQNERLER